jgi:NodT family efflux transporter outer membrane factor (OMF) lipoprotein
MANLIKQLQINTPRKLLANVAAASVLALSLAGCANYRDIHSDAKPRSIDTFASSETFAANSSTDNGGATNSSGEWPTEQWWTAFGDAQLNALIDEALAYNPSLDAAAARVKAAQAYTGTARSVLYPQIDGAADVQYQHFSENWELPPPYGGSSMFNNTLQINASYELDFWGKNRNGVKAAVSSQKAAEAEQQSARLMLTSSIAKTYIELQRLYDLHDVTEQTLQQRDKIFALTQQRVDAGIDSKAELKQAEAQLPALRGQLAQIDEAIGTTRNALAALLGAGPDRGLSIQRPQLATTSSTARLPANVPVDLLGRRPDIVASRWRVEAAQRDTDVAKAQFYPNVNLTGFIGYYSLGLDNITKSSSEMYSAGPAIRLPIFAGGKLRANLKGKYAAYDSAVASYDQTLTDALRDVADQLNALKWLQVRQREQLSALDVARSAEDLATQRYQAGLGNYLSVLSAETLVLAQEQLGTELSARAIDLQVNLIKALGGGFDAQTQNAANTH